MTEHRCQQPSTDRIDSEKAPRQFKQWLKRFRGVVRDAGFAWKTKELVDTHVWPFVQTTVIPKLAEIARDFPYPPYW